MNHKWLIRRAPDPALTRALSAELGILPITAQILINRGITDASSARRFLYPRLSLLPDPFLLPDMEKAVLRIVTALKNSEKLCIFGDYDADGITAAALIIKFLKACGCSADSYIPNRLSEGYGLSKPGLAEIRKSGATLVITVDNGTSCRREIEYANTLGIDVIVTDHHEPPDALPPACAIVNPKLSANSDFAELSGAGVAFYLTAALRSRLRMEKMFDGAEPDLKDYLDLTAIGTVADVAPLTGINRTLVKHGIEALKKCRNTGLSAVFKASATEPSSTDARTIAFRLAPRINAAGRLGNQNLGLQLLLAGDENEAAGLAEKLNQMNAERQAVEKGILDDIEKIYEETIGGNDTVILFSEKWHAGVIGIAAAKIAERHRKPCALISIDGERGRGSARSIGGYSIINALKHCSEALLNFGGHAGAGGFDIETRCIARFNELFEEHAAKHLTADDREQKIEIDAEVEPSSITKQLVCEIEALSPFGEGNPEPVLAINGAGAEDIRTVGRNHLKFRIRDGAVALEAIGFDMGGADIRAGASHSFAGTPALNFWNGRTIVQFKLTDIRS